MYHSVEIYVYCNKYSLFDFSVRHKQSSKATFSYFQNQIESEMQSKGLVLPRHPYRSASCAIKYSTNPSILRGCLGNDYQRYSRSRRLDSFKIYSSTPEQSDPSPEPTSSEPTEPKKEFVSLSSWAEDVSQPTSTDDWGPSASSRPPPRHPLANALFLAALGGIAIGAFFLGRKYSEYLLYIPLETLKYL